MTDATGTNAADRYAFCEPVTAASFTAIHIRRLGVRGLRLTGGADTPALCGRSVNWDVPGMITPDAIEDERTCHVCREKFEELATR